MNAPGSGAGCSTSSWPSGAINWPRSWTIPRIGTTRPRVKADDHGWAEKNLGLEALAVKDFNALWIFQPDLTLWHAKNNRYAESLRDAPLPRAALERLFAAHNVAHFFLQTREGWMEIRGATIHPSRDRFRETTPQGYFFAGRFWIDENIRRMSLFTGYDISHGADERSAGEKAERGGARPDHFQRALARLGRQPVAQIQVRERFADHPRDESRGAAICSSG